MWSRGSLCTTFAVLTVAIAVLGAVRPATTGTPTPAPNYTLSAASAAPVRGKVAVWLTTDDGRNGLTPQRPLTFGHDGPYNPLTIAVDERHIYQRIDGFGGSMTDTSAWLIYTQTPPATRDAVMRRLFDPGAGIGLSFLRQPIGASDFTHDERPYSYDDLPAGQTDPQLRRFSIAHDDAYIIPALQQALRLNPALKMMATPWSPPGWMKANGLMTDNHGLGPLLPGSYAPLARYFVRFIEAYRARGLPIYAVTPQNEPGFAVPAYPGMVITARDEATFIRRYLAPALRAARLHPKILAYDWDWGGGVVSSAYPYDILKDPATAADVAGVSYHCYNGPPDAMTELHMAHPRKDIYEAECSDALPAGRPAAEILINSMRNWARTVVLWNLALDTRDGPSYGGGCATCIGLVTLDRATGKVSYTRDYYQLGHASRFVHPGAYRIDSNSFGYAKYVSRTVQDVAFKNPDGSKALVVYNGALAARTVKVRWGAESFTYTLPSRATVTFVWSGVPSPGAVTPPRPPVYYAIDAGGGGAGRFMPDSYADEGRDIATASTVELPSSGRAARDFAPEAVYQSARYSPIGWDYTFPDLKPGALYGVRLHFAELLVRQRGMRHFDVSIGNRPVLTDFDIIAAAGAADKAVVEEFIAPADRAGRIIIHFRPLHQSPPIVSAVEVVDPALIHAPRPVPVMHP